MKKQQLPPFFHGLNPVKLHFLILLSLTFVAYEKIGPAMKRLSLPLAKTLKYTLTKKKKRFEGFSPGPNLIRIILFLV